MTMPRKDKAIMKNALPWSERVVMLSINPDAATREDVARLAAELMEANRKVERMEGALREEPEDIGDKLFGERFKSESGCITDAYITIEDTLSILRKHAGLG